MVKTLLVICGVLNAIISIAYLLILLSIYPWNGTIALLGKVSLAAGACTIAAAVRRWWPLALNGVALLALGLLHGLVRTRISLLTVALVMIVLAMSLGTLELGLARTARRPWFPMLATAASASFVLVFLTLGFGWIRMQPGSHADFLWLSSFFGFSAVCLLHLAATTGTGLAWSGPASFRPADRSSA